MLPAAATGGKGEISERSRRNEEEMPNGPRLTARKRAFSAHLLTAYDPSALWRPSQQEEHRHLLRLNHQVDALIDEQFAALVSLIRVGHTRDTRERLSTLAAWEPALAEVEEIVRQTKRRA